MAERPLTHGDLYGDAAADDADVRGEHRQDVVAPPKPRADAEAVLRKPGHYAAGADGTQSVTAGVDEQPGSAAPREQP